MDQFPPNHVAIIPDGNSRWSEKSGMSIREGHYQGLKTMDQIVQYLKEAGVRYVTIYAFSSENWKRGEEEKADLFKLIYDYFISKEKEVRGSDTQISFIGNIDKLPKFLITAIRKVQSYGKENKNFFLQIAINYGGRAEIARAFNEIFKKRKDNVSLLTEEEISKHLYTGDIPDPDLLVRTGGVQRLSNFLLYQSSYTELYFSEKYWPDFTKEDMESALKDFKSRERRYGGRLL